MKLTPGRPAYVPCVTAKAFGRTLSLKLYRLCRNDNLHHFLAKFPVPTHRGCFIYAILRHFISITTQSVKLKRPETGQARGTLLNHQRPDNVMPD